MTAAPTRPLWQEALITLALAALIAVVLFGLYLGVAILRAG